MKRAWGSCSRCRAWRGWRRSSSSPSTRSSRSGSATSPTLYEPVPHWNPLDWNVGYILQALEDVRPAAAPGTSSCARCCTSSSRSRCRWRSATRSPTTSSRYAQGRRKVVLLVAARRAVLDLVPDADVRVDEPARQRRLRGAILNALSIDSLFGSVGLIEGSDWLGGQHGHGDHGAGLRLRAVPDPAAVRVAGPDRPAPDRGGARPRRVARERVPARRAAALEGRDAGRDRADRAADVRRLLHARPDVGLAEDGDARQHDQQLRPGRAGQGARAPR